jgi:hypothetical protein
MQNILKLAIFALSLSTTAALAQSPMVQAPAPGTRPAPLVLTSSSFEDGGVIPDKYSGASSSPVSPALVLDRRTRQYRRLRHHRA